VRESREQPPVEAFVVQAAVEALNLAVPLWLFRRGVVAFDAAILHLFQDRKAGQFGPVVADDHQWLAASGDDGVQFAREVVDHCEDAGAPAADQRFADEVQAPLLVGSLR